MGEVVIDSRYVLRDHSAEFAIKKESSWSSRGWSISDGDGNLVFRTERRYMEKRTRLLDATGNLAVCFQKKPLSSSGTWNVFSGSSEVLLFSLKNSRMFQTKTFMNVFLPSNSDTKNPDYKIRNPEMFSSTFSILHGTDEVAVVKHRTNWFGSTALTVTVFPGTDQVFIFTLISIAELVRADRRSMPSADATAHANVGHRTRMNDITCSAASGGGGGGF